MNVSGEDVGLKITIRVSPEDLETIENYMADHNFDNRSTFIREAVKRYMEAQSQESEDGSQTGLYVQLNEVHMSTLKHLVDLGMGISEEDIVRRLVIDKIVPKVAMEEAIDNAFRLAQQQTALK